MLEAEFRKAVERPETSPGDEGWEMEVRRPAWWAMLREGEERERSERERYNEGYQKRN